MKFLKQFSLYTFVGFFGAGINFFLMPYLSHFIKPSEYGILSLVISFVSILVPFVGMVASGILTVEYYKMKDRVKFASLFSSVQLIPVLPGLFFFLIALLIPEKISSFLEIPLAKTYWVPLSVVIATLSIYFETLLAQNMIEQKVYHYTLFYIIKTVIEVGLTIWFVAFLNLSWEGRLLSWIITTIIFFIVSLIYFSRQELLTRNVTLQYARAGTLFGLPLILHTVGKFVINQSDRIFIAKMVSLDEAGIYNIGYQVGMVLLLLVNSAGNFFAPFLYERLSNLNEGYKKEIVKYIYFIIGILFLFLLFLTFIAPYFFSWLVDKSYAKGIIYVFWVGLSYFFWGVYILFSSFIFYTGKTKFLGYLSIVNLTLNIALNYFLILRFGALGAAYATCLSFFVVAALVVWRASSLYKLPWFNFAPQSRLIKDITAD
jgi:O-antigen/teichoic acid export membrane protein